MVAIIVAVVFFVLFVRRHAIVPKTPAQLLAALLGGLPQGAVMISYTTRLNPCYPPELPRAVARLFPCSWLDQDMLLPGIPLEPACLQAASACLFGVLFVCEAYLGSDPCLDEFMALNESGKRNIIFVFPDVADWLEGSLHHTTSPKQERVVQLLRQWRAQPPTDGPTLFVLTPDDKAALTTNPAYFMLRACLTARTFIWLFRLHTPFVFGKWRATAYMLSGAPRRSRYFGFCLVATWLIPLGVSLSGVFYSDRTAAVDIVIVVYVGILFGVVYLIHGMFRGLVGTILPAHHLVEPASLLIVLHRLGIIRRVVVRTGGLHEAKFKALADVGVISLQPPHPEERQLAFIDARKILNGSLAPHQYEPERGRLFPAVWRDDHFTKLELEQLPKSINQSWVHTAKNASGLEYLTMCSLLLLFALDHQSLEGQITGIHLRPNNSSSETLKGKVAPSRSK